MKTRVIRLVAAWPLASAALLFVVLAYAAAEFAAAFPLTYLPPYIAALPE